MRNHHRLTDADHAALARFAEYLTRLGPRYGGAAEQRAFRAWHHRDPAWRDYLGLPPLTHPDHTSTSPGHDSGADADTATADAAADTADAAADTADGDAASGDSAQAGPAGRPAGRGDDR